MDTKRLLDAMAAGDIEGMRGVMEEASAEKAKEKARTARKVELLQEGDYSGMLAAFREGEI